MPVPCTSSEALAYLPGEITIWCWAGQVGGVYLLGNFSMWEGNFFPDGENEKIFGWFPNPHHCVERCISLHLSFFILPSWYPPYLPKHATHSPLDTHHRKIPDSMMIHQNQGDWLPIKTVCLNYILNVSWIDILVTISIAVGTGCNFPHGEVGTKSHHIKTWK